MTKSARRRVHHKITMALLKAEHYKATPTEAKSLQWDAEVILGLILVVYEQKRGAGALWLDRKLKDEDWLDAIHNQALKIQRNCQT